MIEKVLVDPGNPERLLAFGGSSRRWGRGASMGAVWISENGGDPTRIIWTDENQFVYIYCPSADKKPENFIYEIWIRAELPEYARKAFNAME
jgi:hypothetical protein